MISPCSVTSELLDECAPKVSKGFDTYKFDDNSNNNQPSKMSGNVRNEEGKELAYQITIHVIRVISLLFKWS